MAAEPIIGLFDGMPASRILNPDVRDRVSRRLPVLFSSGGFYVSFVCSHQNG
jgi:hypothetical protein